MNHYISHVKTSHVETHVLMNFARGMFVSSFVIRFCFPCVFAFVYYSGFAVVAGFYDVGDVVCDVRVAFFYGYAAAFDADDHIVNTFVSNYFYLVSIDEDMFRFYRNFWVDLSYQYITVVCLVDINTVCPWL